MLRHRALAGLPWSSPSATMPVPTASISARPGGGRKGGSGDPSEVLQEWSSLIGIITAIVGNILIAIALNVQRYAHTRLQRERIRVRQRARAAMRRAKSGNQPGQYGTIDTGGQGDDNGDISAGQGRDAQSPGSNGAGGDPESQPLSASFHSERTLGSQDDSEADEDKVASTYLKSPYWWLGQILITLGEMGNFLAYGFAPASIVSPLGVVALISNCVIAPLMFHERFRQRDFWGVVVAVCGVVTVVLSANQEEGKLNPHDVWDAITTLEFEVYLGVTVLLILILMVASSKYGRRTLLIDLGLVGLFGGYTALATKGVSSMLSSTLWGAFTTPVTYVLVFILLSTAIMQIRYVNKALQRFNSTQVIPIQFVMFTLCVIIGSAVLYRDFEKTTPEQAGKFVGGCLLTFFGVFLITNGREQNEEEEDILSETDGVEETINLRDHDGHPTTPGQEEAPVPESRSRRSSRFSRVSFAETVKPGSPPRDGVDSLPVLKYTTSEGSEAELAPESAPLLGSPWVLQEITTPPPRGFRTISAESFITTPGTASYPVSPLIGPPGMASRSGESVGPLRPPLGPSRSGSHQRPGTFINPSPLSSTVTSVFKDAFLRGRDDALPKRSSLRRIRSTIRAGLFFNDDEDAIIRAIVPASEDNLAGAIVDQQNRDDDTVEDDASRRRSRSVSDTLGNFFRPKRNRRLGSTQSDVEEGGSGSADTDSASEQTSAQPQAP